MRITLPDGRVANFPDDMPHSEIESVLQKQFPMQAKQPESKQPSQELGYQRGGFSGIAQDAAESLISAPGAGLKALMGLPEHYQAGKEYVEKNPWYKTAGQLAMGAPELAAGLFNVPYKTAQYLKEKDIPVFKQTADYVPRIPMDKIEAALGISPAQKGSGELRAIGQIIAGGKPFASLPSRAARVGVTTATAAGQGGDPIHAALAAWLGEKGFGAAKKAPAKISDTIERRAEIKAIPDTQSAVAEAERQAINAGYDLQQTKDAAMKDFKSNTLPGLEGKVGESQEKIAEDTPIAQQQMPSPESLIQPEEPSFSIADAQQQHQQSVNDIQQHLYHRQEPDVIASREVVSDFENNVKGAAQDLYKANDDLLRNESITMPAELNPSVYIGDLQEIINTSGWGTTQAASLAKQLNAINKTEEVPAREFYNAARTARQTATATRKSAYSGGKTAEEFDRLIAKADALDDQAQSMFDVLEQAPFGEEVMNNLSEANRLWREQVAPVEKNSLYKQMKSKGRVDGKILDKLRGTESGLDVLNQIISNNPVATRASFGDAYANNPNLLLNMSQREQQMAEQHPEFQQRIDRLATTSQGIQQTEQAHAQHRSALEQFNDAAKQAAAIDKARKFVAKEKNKIQGMSMMIDKLKADLSRKGLSTQKATELKSKLDKAVSDKEKSSSIIRKVAKSIASAYVGNEVVSIVNKITK